MGRQRRLHRSQSQGFLIAEGFLPAADPSRLSWTVAFAVMLSILVHGIGATAIARRLLGRETPSQNLDGNGPIYREVS